MCWAKINTLVNFFAFSHVQCRPLILDKVTGVSSGDERCCCVRVTAACDYRLSGNCGEAQFISSPDSNFSTRFSRLWQIYREGHVTEFIAGKSAVVRKLTCLVYARRQYNIQARCVTASYIPRQSNLYYLYIYIYSYCVCIGMYIESFRWFQWRFQAAVGLCATRLRLARNLLFIRACCDVHDVCISGAKHLNCFSLAGARPHFNGEQCGGGGGCLTGGNVGSLQVLESNSNGYLPIRVVGFVHNIDYCNIVVYILVPTLYTAVFLYDVLHT